MRKLQKRGTEKPIEIFVALFVILAVALVMLKLFQGQITQKQTELQAFQQEQKQQELKEKATLYCKDKCNQASNDGCSLPSLASLCISFGSDIIKDPDFLDLNNNQVMDWDTTQLPGIGICEDRVPCFALISTCCGRVLSASECRTILDSYTASAGVSLASLGMDNPGACTGPQPTTTWLTQFGTIP